MKQIGTVKIHCISEALSPITHMMGTSGNEAILNRESVVFENSITKIPFISGNSIRHKAIRETGARFLVEALGLHGKLTIDQANYMFNGGSLTESSTNSNMGKIADMQMLFPFFRMIGGSLRNQVIGGSLFVGRGSLICEENKENIDKQLPKEFKLPSDYLLKSESFVSNHQYTTSDVAKTKDAGELLKEQMGEKDKSNLMIYSGQNIIVGSMFYHNLILQNVSPLEVGALLHALFQWQKEGGTIGGSARIGHGKLESNIFIEDVSDFFGKEIDPNELIIDYINHVNDHADACIDWLNETFPEKNK